MTADRSSGTGAVGLLGGHELNPPCGAFDRRLLDAAGGPTRVHLVPTALHRGGSPAAAMELARRHFASLGVEAVEVPFYRRSDLRRPDVREALAEAELVYLLGGDPGYLGTTLRESGAAELLATALASRRAVAGSSAGAMVLASGVLLRSRNPRPEARHAVPGMGVLAGTVVIPHLEHTETGWLAAARREAPGSLVLGLDECTGVVWRPGDGWLAAGPGRVVVWHPDGRRDEAHDGDRIDLPEPGAAASGDDLPL